MQPPLLAFVSLVAAAAATAQSTVYDNTGGLAPLDRGMLIHGSGATGFAKAGAMFIAPSDFTLDRVELGLWAVDNGTTVTAVTASLYTSFATDGGDLPGTFLDSVTIAAPGSAPAYYTFDFADTYSFTEGTKLWITLVNATGTLVWSHNAARIGGMQQQSFDPDPTLWNPGEEQNPQITLKVFAIPEPATSAILFGACGLIAVALYRRTSPPRKAA
ncbi:MAG TPA: hypothetical protein VGD81_00590 [Opitutaceae bacterium]